MPHVRATSTLSSEPMSLSLSASGRMLAAALLHNDGGVIEVRETSNLEVVGRYGAPHHTGHAVLFAEDDRVLHYLAALPRGVVELRRVELSDGSDRVVAEYAGSEQAHRLARSHDSTRLLVLGRLAELRDAATGQVVTAFPVDEETPASSIAAGAFSPDGGSLHLYGVELGTVVTIDLSSGEAVRRLAAPGPRPGDVSCSPNGAYISVTGDLRTGVFLYDTEGARVGEAWASEKMGASSMPFTFDGRRVLWMVRGSPWWFTLPDMQRETSPPVLSDSSKLVTRAEKADVFAAATVDGEVAVFEP
jgi:hypothetical protein